MPAQAEEFIVELDRPERARRRNRAKSDLLDAIPCGPWGTCPQVGTPRASGDRQALSVLLVARRSVAAAPVAQKIPGHTQDRHGSAAQPVVGHRNQLDRNGPEEAGRPFAVADTRK